jgi:hypothetical protein
MHTPCTALTNTVNTSTSSLLSLQLSHRFTADQFKLFGKSPEAKAFIEFSIESEKELSI